MPQLFNIHNYLELLEYLTNLEKSVQDVDREQLIAEISKPAAINHVRNIVMSSVGTAELPKILTRFDSIITEMNPALPKELNDIYIGNLSFFAPSYFWHNFPYFCNIFPLFRYHASTVFLARQGNLEKLICALRENMNLKLSPTLAVQCAFRASADQVQDEKDICALLETRLHNVPGFAVAQAALRQRQNSISNGKYPSLPKMPRIALLISGQCRDIEQMLPKLSRQYDLPNMDVYVSTWQAPGMTPIDRTRLARRLKPDAVDEVRQLFTDAELGVIARFELNLQDSAPSFLSDKLKIALQDAKELKIFLANENDVVYSGMDNHQKMHFHNAYWVRKLGHQYFLDNYDIVIKARPDILMKLEQKIGPSSIKDVGGNIACDHPKWLYETWGFGAGDQVFYGRTPVMLKLLDIQYPKSLSTRLLTEVFMIARIVQGHINIGIELWLSGGNPISASITKMGLATERKLTRDEFLELAATAGVQK